MTKNIFTPEFYQKMYDALMDVDWSYNDDYEAVIEGLPVAEDCYVDDYYITADKVYYDKEFVDESFDHAYGTWHDPFAHYEVTGIYNIDCVHVYENDQKGAKEIFGFDKEAFLKVA